MRGKARHIDYAGNLNPQILHRKEAFLPAEHPKRPLFVALTEAEEAEGLYENTATIGFKLNVGEAALRETVVQERMGKLRGGHRGAGRPHLDWTRTSISCDSGL